MASIEIRAVDKAFGNTQVLHGVDLEVADGEFLVLVGPSGCGKSTLLRLIAGLDEVSGGEVVIGGRVVNDLAAKDRDIAMVFQNYALYPHMTVRDNMAFSLKMRNETKATIAKKVADAAETLNLTPYLDRYPRQLSGGPAAARRHGPGDRARPGGLPLRRTAIQPGCEAPGADAGRDQIAPPAPARDVDLRYARPDRSDDDGRPDRRAARRAGRADRHAAGTVRPPVEPFRRRLHRLAGDESRSGADAAATTMPSGSRPKAAPGCRFPAPRNGQEGQEVVYGFRPEKLSLGAAGDGVPARILVIEPTGADTHVYCELCGTQVCAVFGERLEFRTGETIWVRPKAEAVHVFDSTTGKVLT